MNDTNWRQSILDHFSPSLAEVTRLTVVVDPDELLLEQGVLDGLRAAGFELVPFDDPVAFRFHYESQYRERWDRGERTNLVVVLRTPEASEDALPFDLLEEARRERRILRFGIGRVFEHLAPSVVRSLDRRHFDPLWTAVVDQAPRDLGERQTRDFILRWVYAITPEQLQTPSQLLQVLVHRHYNGESLPPELDAYLLEQLRKSGRWAQWPLERLLSDRSEFLTFLQERWTYFLNRKARNGNVPIVASPEQGHQLRIPGTVDLPFDDVSFLVDNLFAEGLLAPVEGPADLPDGWWRVGVVSHSPEEAAARRFETLTRLVGESVPPTEADRTAWLAFAARFAEWLALRWAGHGSEESCRRLHAEIELRFGDWMRDHYAALANLPYLPSPTMVHHLAPFLRAKRKGTDRVALVVVDGLALDQWVVLRHALQPGGAPKYTFDERALFAWVPTLTSVSRQAIFAGQSPLYFANSIGSTAREREHWQRVWVDGGLAAPAVSHVVHGEEAWESFITNVRRAVERPNCRALGVVVNTVDRIMHGSILGSGEMHTRVLHWAGTGELRELLDLLLGHDYDVWLTADHGNVQGQGIGRPNAGVAADVAGHRAFAFETAVQRDLHATSFPDADRWAGPGLPPDYHALLAPHDAVFWTKGVRLVAHGGASIEEVIVPLVRVGRAP